MCENEYACACIYYIASYSKAKQCDLCNIVCRVRCVYGVATQAVERIYPDDCELFLFSFIRLAEYESIQYLHPISNADDEKSEMLHNSSRTSPLTIV